QLERHDAVLSTSGRKPQRVICSSCLKRYERPLLEIDAEQRIFVCHWAISELLNKYPPLTVYFDRHITEVPPNDPRVILPMTYHLLRRDYLAEQKSVALCANPKCQRFF